jgi:hypothetical protein
VSLYFAQPSWQPTPGGYTRTAGRFVPDVAFSASPDHNAYMSCSSDNNSTQYGTMCASGFFSSGGTSGEQVFYPIGGTSASTPSFAGMLTLLVQKYRPLGPVNPTLYGLAANASTASVFNQKAFLNDITSGNNIVPCVVETTDPGCVGGTMGYTATAGYDMTTGLGSINGVALYAALAPPSAAATSTNLEAAPNPALLNGTTTLTAAVTSTTAGTITGNVTFTLGSKTLGETALSGGWRR